MLNITIVPGVEYDFGGWYPDSKQESVHWESTKTPGCVFKYCR